MTVLRRADVAREADAFVSEFEAKIQGKEESGW